MKLRGFCAFLAALLPLVSNADEYPPNTVLVVSPPNYPFAGVEISGEIPGAVPVEIPLVQAMAAARQNQNVIGIIDVMIAAESLFERGRVTCYSPTGKKQWAEKVMFNMGGGADKIAEKFSARLAGKVHGKHCP